MKQFHEIDVRHDDVICAVIGVSSGDLGQQYVGAEQALQLPDVIYVPHRQVGVSWPKTCAKIKANVRKLA